MNQKRIKTVQTHPKTFAFCSQNDSNVARKKDENGPETIKNVDNDEAKKKCPKTVETLIKVRKKNTQNPFRILPCIRT